jgi:hypothetical protein
VNFLRLLREPGCAGNLPDMVLEMVQVIFDQETKRDRRIIPTRRPGAFPEFAPVLRIRVRSANAKVAWRWNWAGFSVTGWVPVPEANDLDGFNTWLYARCGEAQQHIVSGLNATLSRLTSHRTRMACPY